MSSHPKIHFIGLCGAGMAAVAMLVKELGWTVSGSDDGFYPPISTLIENSGIAFSRGYSARNIPPDTDIIVIGKHAGLVPENNEEVKEAFMRGVRVISFPELLGELTRDRTNIVVAGSYGKSTCSALLAWCLTVAGNDPGYFIGAIPATPDHGSQMGHGNFFVLEGDEYPSANWDGRSKFSHYHPRHVLLTSLAHDHLNVFKTVEDYRKPFREMISALPEDGVLVACADGDGVTGTLSEMNRDAILYGTRSQWHAENIRYGEWTTFEIYNKDRNIVSLKTRLLGRHNIENVVGVAALLFSIDALSPEKFSKAIETFRAPERRMNKKSERTAIPVYEGFGSSADKVRSAIDAMRTHYPDKKVIVLFEPHSLTWRNRSALPWYDSTFQDASHVLIYRPESSTEMTSQEIVSRIEASGPHATVFKTTDQGLVLLKDIVDADSTLLILSSGGFGGMIEPTVGFLEEAFPR